MTSTITKVIKNLLILISVFIIADCKAQTFCGNVLDSKSRPVEYVNIGIIGKNIGTVSDENGNFTIELNNQYDKDTLKFSMIGYKNRELIVGDFKREYPSEKTVQIKLDKNITTLKEITVKPKKYVTKILGNTANSTSITGSFESNDLGSEVGTVIKIKRSPTFIENANFNIATNSYDTVTFRLNIYKMKDGLPSENILNEPIFVTTVGNTRILTVDLRKYNLIVEDDFFVSLEWIKDLQGNGLTFCGGIFNADSFSRKTSQGSWNKIEVFGIGFNATVTYEK